MTANLPTKTPDAPPAKSGENKVDRFHPDMPTIPGVSRDSRQAARGLSGMNRQRLLQIAGVVGAVVLISALIFWRVKGKPRGAANSAPDSDIAEQAAPSSPAPNPVVETQNGLTVAATLDEISKPWDAKKFTFVKPFSQENIDAMVIRLPDGGLWAFSLQDPSGRCKLDYITDLGTLASQYSFKASHPMVVNLCNNTVYDPLKLGPLGGDTWARGEIVQGISLRPPISIDVKVSGRSIVADGIE